MQLRHKSLHVKLLAQDEQNGIITSYGAEHLADTEVVDRHRYGTRIARLSGYHTHITRKGDTSNIIRDVRRHLNIAMRIIW